MKKGILFAAITLLVVSGLGLAGCSKGSTPDTPNASKESTATSTESTSTESKSEVLVGTWNLDGNKDAPFVFTKNTIRGNNTTTTYRLEGTDTFVMFAGEDNEDKMTYKVSDDGKTLTLSETVNGKDSTLTFQKADDTE